MRLASIEEKFAFIGKSYPGLFGENAPIRPSLFLREPDVLEAIYVAGRESLPELDKYPEQKKLATGPNWIEIPRDGAAVVVKLPYDSRRYRNERMVMTRLNRVFDPECIARPERLCCSGEIGGNGYLIKESVTHLSTVYKLLPGIAVVEPEQVLNFLSALLNVTATLHENRVVHQNIHGGHVFTTNEFRQLRLIDWDFAKPISRFDFRTGPFLQDIQAVGSTAYSLLMKAGKGQHTSDLKDLIRDLSEPRINYFNRQRAAREFATIASRIVI